MVGGLLIHTVSLREFIVGLRMLHVPQKLIIPISVTLRYFPAIKEETGYIRDAMRLRNIRGPQKAEALIVPLMVSATATAEELSAAAVTRGIEDPAKKTSLVELTYFHMGLGVCGSRSHFSHGSMFLIGGGKHVKIKNVSFPMQEVMRIFPISPFP